MTYGKIDKKNRHASLILERRCGMEAILQGVSVGILKAVGVGSAVVGLYFGVKWGWKLSEWIESRKANRG